MPTGTGQKGASDLAKALKVLEKNVKATAKKLITG